MDATQTAALAAAAVATAKLAAQDQVRNICALAGCTGDETLAFLDRAVDAASVQKINDELIAKKKTASDTNLTGPGFNPLGSTATGDPLATIVTATRAAVANTAANSNVPPSEVFARAVAANPRAYRNYRDANRTASMFAGMGQADRYMESVLPHFAALGLSTGA